MKSLFKRSLAAATSSLLALTQLASMAGVNISADETAAANGIDITMDAILNIPVSSEDFETTPDENGMVWAGKTDISNRIDAAIRSGSEKHFTVSAANMREKVQSALAGTDYLTPAEIDEIIAAISDADVTVNTEGEAVIEISLDEIGQVVGPAFERFVQKAMNIDFSDPDAPIVVDWTGFSVAGKIVVKATANFDDNTVEYTTIITDENGKVLNGHEAVLDYVVAKLDDASNRTLTSAQNTKEEKQADVDNYQEQLDEKKAEKEAKQKELNEAKADLDAAVEQGADDKTIMDKKDEVDDAQAKLDDAQIQLDDAQAQLDEANAILADAQNKLDKAKTSLNNAEEKIKSADKLVEAVASISEKENTLDELYAALVHDGKALVDQTDFSEARKNQIKNKIYEKAPASVFDAMDNEKVQKAYNAAVNAINENYGDIATISVSLADIKAVIEDAEGQKPEFAASYEVNGYSGSAVLYATDDQQDDLLAAALETGKTAEDFYTAGWTVVLGAEDGPLVTDFTDATKDYEIIEVVSRKKISVSADTDYLLAGKVQFDVQRVITQIVVKEIDVTTTTTTTTTTDSTATSTSTTDSTTSTSATDSTATSTSTSVTDNTDTSETTSTTPATYVSFEIKGVEDKGLVYWSEETSEFDLSDLSITLRVFESGVETDLAIDVTDAFELEKKSPSDLVLPDAVGLSATKVFFTLKDVAAVTDALKSAGYGEDLIAQEGIKEGYRAGNLLVYLVLRGDTDLNGVIDVKDAQISLIYYAETILSLRTADEIFADPYCGYLKPGLVPMDQERYYAFSHYAMDVFDGNGIIGVEDAQWILVFYAEQTLAMIDDTTWDKIMSEADYEVPVIPRDDLHANSLKYDKAAGEYADKGYNYIAAKE